MNLSNKTLCELSDGFMEKMSALAELFVMTPVSAEGIALSYGGCDDCNNTCAATCGADCTAACAAEAESEP
jgi:hypothetical protein